MTKELYNPKPLEDVLFEVRLERHEQDKQWGGPAHDDTHLELDWLSFIDHQVDLLVNEAETPNQIRDRFIKIAALAVAAVESLDRKAVK